MPKTTKKLKKKKAPALATDAMLVTDDNYFSVLMTLLDHAKKSVDIIEYSFAIGQIRPGTKPGTPLLIAQKLKAIKKKWGAKIKIRLYLEGHRETSERNRVTAAYLKKSGVQIRFGSTHAKGFCIDHRYVLFGSTNLTHQSITKNNETNLLLDDPAVTKGYNTYFKHLWEGGEHGGIKLPPPLIADGGFKDELIAVIDRAKTRLEFSIYFLHHTEIETALIRAHQRGVKVHGLIHNHKSFAMSYVRRTHAAARRLMNGGIRDLRLGPAHLFTHSKFIVRDREEILLGTGNWLHEDVKVHPQLYIRLENPKLARELGLQLQKKLKQQGSPFSKT